MESSPFAVLARLKVLVIPVGDIPRAKFEEWATVVRGFESIPLFDIPPAMGEDKSRFMPPPPFTGYLHLQYTSHPPPVWHHSISLFRPSAFPLGVVGISVCTSSTSLHELLDDFNSRVAQLYPYGSPYPLAKICFAFEEGSEHIHLNTADNGVEVIPNVLGGNKKVQHIGMLLAGLCSHILASFSILSKALESSRGFETLHSAVFPSHPMEDDQGLSQGGAPRPRITVDTPNGTSLPSTPTNPSFSDSNLATPRNSSMVNTLRRSTTQSGLQRNSLITGMKRNSAGLGAGPPNARLSKIIADLYLLAGRLKDATIWYEDAVTQFRSSNNDPVWYAAAVEGQVTVTVLEAWASMDGLKKSLAHSSLRDPWADVSDKMSKVLEMYSHAPLGTNSTEYPSLALLYTDAALRYCNFFFSIWSASGWGPMALQGMMSPGLPPVFKDKVTPAHRWRMTSMSTITRTQIANVAAMAHGPWLMQLQPHDRIRVLSALATVYSCLGFVRKEVYVLREVLSVVMDLIVSAREDMREGLTSAISPGGSPGTAPAQISIREHEFGDGNESVVRIVRHICAVYGVDLGAVRLLGKDPSPMTNGMGGEEEKKEGGFDEDAEMDIAKPLPFGWAELQVGVVREAVAIAEALPDFVAVAQFALSTLRTLYIHLTAQEQQHLYNTTLRALQVTRRRGEEPRVEFWSVRPVVSVEVAPLPFVRIPVEHPKSDLHPRETLMNPVARRDPFIYNPRLKSVTASQALVVQNEQLEFVVTVQNPFSFDLELPSVTLSTTGVPFESKPVGAVIPSNTFDILRITGIAVQPGILIIRGCTVQVLGSIEPKEFLLPLSTEEADAKHEKRRSMRVSEIERTKWTGLDARPAKERERKGLSAFPGASENPEKSEKAMRFLECKVVPEQPLLRVRRTSLTHGAVMLYDGESSTIRLTVENISTLPVDFIKLTFDDSTIAPAQQALTEGDLPIAEAYETEYALLKRPVFSWKSRDEPKEVKPGKKAVLAVSCLGKVGCVHGTIQIAYSHAHCDPNSDKFYTRQILYPVLVTVYHTLECHAMDILPFVRILAAPPPVDEDEDVERKTRRELLDIEDDEGDWCLFSMDVKNSYGLPFEVHFERRQSGSKPASATRLVPPGSTSRIILPLRRLSLPLSLISRPIPTLSDRQFVVSKSRLSEADLRTQRELFWYREELFNCIDARWREPGGTRFGELSLRQQRLTRPMLDSLRTDAVRVAMELVEYEDDNNSGEGTTLLPAKGGKVTAPANKFLYLQARITNMTASSLPLVLSIAASPLEHFHWEGSLTDIPVGRTEPRESKEVDIPLCFVTKGQFEFVGEVRVLGDLARSGEGELKVLVR